ncbi:unnamed protein product, partial [Aphanomyces euteiches]
MPTTVTDCILGVDYLRRVHAVIDLAHNELRIPGVSSPLGLIRHPSNGFPSTSNPTGQIASITVSPPKKQESSWITIENPTRLKANSSHMVCCTLGDPTRLKANSSHMVCCTLGDPTRLKANSSHMVCCTLGDPTRLKANSSHMVCCTLGDPSADGSDILVENLPGALAPRIACSLNTVRNGKLWIQIGFGTTLPDVYADGSDDPVPPKPPDPNPVEPECMPRNGDTVLTQQVYPGVIASVTDERLSSIRRGKDTRNDIPINWDGSSLDPLQREMIRKLLLEFDIF